MNADRAREIATSINTSKICKLLEHVYAQIETAANQRKLSVTNPMGVRTPVNDDEAEAVWADLRQNGYTVKSHDDGQSAMSVTVSWK